MKVCQVEGCGLSLRGRGYCDKHYQQWRKFGHVKPMPVCEVCGGTVVGRVRHDAKVCAGPCDVEWRRRYQAERHEKIDKSRRISARYRLPEGWYEAELERLKGTCPTCHSMDVRQWVVDHDHWTERVRGLICSNCNVAIGMAGESADVLRSLADYLDRSNRVVEVV